MKKNTLNEGGQSLVEVTVALCILAVVLTGVVTLAVNATGLMLSSRMKTEATALAQEGLEIAKSGRSGNCNGDPDSANGSFDIGGITYTRTTSVSSSAAFSGASMLTVTVVWSERGTTNSQIKIVQLIK